MEVTFARFVAALRNADVRVSPAETLDAFDVVSRVGIADKDLLKDALALTLAKSRDEKARFDDTFERFFQLAFREPAQRSFLQGVDREGVVDELRGELPAGLVEAVANVLDDDRDRLALRIQQVGEALEIHRISSLREKSVYSRRIAQALGIDELDAYVAAGGNAGGDGGEDAGGEGGTERASLARLRYLRQYFHRAIRDYIEAQYRLHVDASGKRALLDAALKSNLDQLPPAYHRDVRRVVVQLAEKLAKEHRRKRKRASRGMLDVKRTLRRNIAYDGALFDLKWRRQKREQGSVFVLCDVSSSVARVARFLLLFLYELTDVLPNVRAFAFSSRLGEITDIMRGKASEAAIEEALFTWGKGNTDYARAFFDFREQCGADLNPRASLIVLGDARSNYYDPRTDIFEELTRRAKQTFWLNPETRDQWRDGDSVMNRYAPYCFRVDTCNKLRDIERFADRLLLATR